MKNNDAEVIRKMLKKQAKLDKAIMEEYGLEELDEEKLNLAILDEIKEKECISCKFYGVFCKNECDDKKYEKKSKECWKEFFLTGEIKC